jgi:hypothetical protein
LVGFSESSKKMTFSIIFETPEKVSSGAYLDQVQVGFWNPAIFEASDGVMLRAGTTIVAELPRQVSPEFKNFTDSVST